MRVPSFAAAPDTAHSAPGHSPTHRLAPVAPETCAAAKEGARP
jgi:hypothetical protein